jgi:fatty acid desaturase
MSTVTLTATREGSASAPVPTPAPTAKAGPAPTFILIDDQWYDLTHWKKSHPGGPLIIEQMHGNDSTDAFYSLHSKEAIDRMKRLPHSPNVPACLASNPPPPPTKATGNFRAFRAQLEKEGWFNRNIMWELFYALSVYVMAAAGTYLAFTGHPVWATILLGFCMQQAGWISHDHTHGRGAGCEWVGYCMSGPINAFSRSWWSNKHNTHHVFTNYIGVDADIENDPVFHLFFPKHEDDTIFRKMQHWYFVPVASVLYFSWRMQSLQYAWAKKNYLELALFVINYAWLYQLGWAVSLGAIYLGGGLVAVIVTATHQSEEMIDPVQAKALIAQGESILPTTTVDITTLPAAYSFCEGQFATTRDARTSDFFTEWLWGGMQYQLEHHLFPTMPKYYYSQVAKKVEKFAKDNGLSYRVDTQMEIFSRNFNTLKYYAADAPKKEQ